MNVYIFFFIPSLVLAYQTRGLKEDHLLSCLSPPGLMLSTLLPVGQTGRAQKRLTVNLILLSLMDLFFGTFFRIGDVPKSMWESPESEPRHFIHTACSWRVDF